MPALLLGVALGSDHVQQARAAEQAGIDFVTLDDALAGPGQDAVITLSRVATATESIGLIATATTTHTEPFHVSKAIATLDWVSLGRAGWRPKISTSAAEARHFGRKGVASLAELHAEADEFIDVVVRLWDSWEDDAEIRDVATGRFVDRDKLHYVDFVGRFFEVKGPSIVPRPPQGHPVVAVQIDSPGLIPIAARHADLVFVSPSDVDSAPLGKKVLVNVEFTDTTTLDAFSAPVDGFHVSGDVDRFLREVAPALRDRSPEATTLRERLGLTRPANRYAEVSS